MENLKEKTAKGLFWGGLSNSLQQLLTAFFGIFLARMLSQYDYGIVGILTVFSNFALILFEGGFVAAINQKKHVTHKDYNAVFWTTLLLSLFFYVLLFFCAPYIADFYSIPELIPLSRYLFISLPITALGLAPRAYMFRNMMVREEAITSFFCLLISGSVGIFMAALGFAYWGIATQTILFLFIATIMRFFFSRWRPTFYIDFHPIKELLNFSIKLIITNIFNAINNNVFSAILGKLYTPKEVGNYTQANKWNSMGTSFINGMLGGVTQPIFAKVDEQERQKRIFRKLLRFTSFISFPAMFGFSLVAQEFITLLLTEKWLESARLMQLLCIGGAFAPISNLFSNLIIGRGQSGKYMWTTISLCIVQLIGVYFSAPFGIECMIVIYIIINVIWIIIWYYLSRQIINITFIEVLKDIVPFFIIASFVISSTYFLTQSITNNVILLATRIPIAALLYILILRILNAKVLEECFDFLRKKIKK